MVQNLVSNICSKDKNKLKQSVGGAHYYVLCHDIVLSSGEHVFQVCSSLEESEYKSAGSCIEESGDAESGSFKSCDELN